MTAQNRFLHSPYVIGGIVFVTGGVVMAVEILGSRILAPFLGTSLPVWTSVIGVILAALSLGYWFGGRLADRSASPHGLARVLFASSVSISLIAFLDVPLLAIVSIPPLDLRIKAVFASAVLLAPPSVLLGIVTPYAVRLTIQSVSAAGAHVGSLYALSTLGSIIGTFATGFFFLAYFHTNAILFTLSALVLVCSLILQPFRIRSVSRITGIAIIAIGSFSVSLFHSLASQVGYVSVPSSYHSIRIIDTTDSKTKRPKRSLFLNGALHSVGYRDNPGELAHEYSRFYGLFALTRPQPERVLMLGGGAYAYPQNFLRSFASARMDVVEIDPAVTRVAREFFSLSDDVRLTIYHEDARTFLNRSDATYDAIFGDVFFSSYAIPFQVVTKESFEQINRLLRDDGIFIANVASAVEGKKGRTIRAIYHTAKTVFEHVYIFPLTPDKPDAMQNVMLVATKKGNPFPSQTGTEEFDSLLAKRWTKPIPQDVPLLSDDYAPVDQFMANAAER
ncbi:fused MFS/spermidine synthase [Candidatus Uhrbacteria bacterium]|nr:fused MFS/spermidine synthase [Candidatus Uhrbacteria bacterium]